MNVGPDDWLVRAAELEMAAEHERDNYSFEDSERFEGDSECSWFSSEESINQNWRGWAASSQGEALQQGVSSVYPYQFTPHSGRLSSASTSTVVARLSRAENRTHVPHTVTSLSELAARSCARNLSFDQLELLYKEVVTQNQNCTDEMYPSMLAYSIPDKLFLSVIRLCFPTSVDDICLYSCLANGNGDEFQYGESLYQFGAVSEVVQIGYLISAVVRCTNEGRLHPNGSGQKRAFNVSLRVDRCRIVSCSCSCESKSSWCFHVVALCLYRLLQPDDVEYRVTIWDSVNELSSFKLKKFAQYLINELPREYLPVAQKLLDQLKDPNSDINNSLGAPDPTDGGHEEVPLWCLEEQELHLRIRRLLVKYSVPAPIVYSDVNMMTTPTHSQHPIALEWRTLWKALRAREPEGLWNLVSIVREMFVRGDGNALSLLRIMTEECLANSQILLWWYVSKLVQSNDWFQMNSGKNGDSSHSGAQLNAALLCDELVSLWRCAAMNPSLSKEHRLQLFMFLQNYHRTACNRIWTIIKGAVQEGPITAATTQSVQSQLLSSVYKRNAVDEMNPNHLPARESLSVNNARFGMAQFPGFHLALQTCYALQNANEDSTNQLSFSNNVNPLISQWCVDEESVVPLQPGPLTNPVAVAKRKKKKRSHNRHASPRGSRRNGRGSDRQRVAIAPDQDSSGESGQESEQEGRRNLAADESTAAGGFPQEDVDGVLAASYLPMDPFEMRFAQCEALSAHGFTQQTVDMALDLSKSLLTYMNGGDSFSSSFDKPGGSRDSQSSSEKDVLLSHGQRIVDSLEKALHLAHIIRTSHQFDGHLFSFVLSVLQYPKMPMSTKFQQFKEYYLECELIGVLQQIYLGTAEVEQLRRAALHLCETVANGGIPHVALATYLFEKLSYTPNVCELDQNGQPISRVVTNRAARDPSDDDLCLRAALDALGARVLVSETEFPMLNEVIRRQKGDLALALMIRFKDSKEKLGLIMDKLLDPHVHRMYRYHQSNAAYFLERDNILIKHCIRGQRPVFPYATQPQPVPVIVRSTSVSSDNVGQEDEVDQLSEGLMRIGSRSSRQHSDQTDSARSSTDSEPMASTSTASPMRPASIKRWRMRQLADLATEAHAHYMAELSKRVVEEAGGNQNPVVFAPIMGQNHLIQGGPHRNLRICGVLIALYGLGLHNKVSPSWTNRTYNGHISWISAQAIEIGSTAIEIIRDTWDAHYTPSEVASLADKASSESRDPGMVREAALLALSVLPKAHALSGNETRKALLQCKEQGSEMLERACKAIEAACEQDKLLADILFGVARFWESLHQEMELPANPQLAAVPPQQYAYPNQQHVMAYPPSSMYVPPPMFVNQQGMMGGMTSQNVHANSRPTSSLVAPMNMLVPPPPPDMGKQLHQSHSAPQLAAAQQGRPAEGGCFRLIQAHRMGMRAIESIPANQLDDSRSKFSQTPIYADDVMWLMGISCKLGPIYAFNFLDGACRNIQSPYLLYKLAVDSINLVKQFVHHGVPIPSAVNTSTYNQHTGNVAKVYAHVAGQVRQCFLQHHYHPTTAELFEKCIEQFYVAVTTKLNFNRFNSSDKEEAQQLLQTALEALHYVPLVGRSIFDDLCRVARKQKSCKREIVNVINELQKRNQIPSYAAGGY